MKAKRIVKNILKRKHQGEAPESVTPIKLTNQVANDIQSGAELIGNVPIDVTDDGKLIVNTIEDHQLQMQVAYESSKNHREGVKAVVDYTKEMLKLKEENADKYVIVPD